MSPTPPPAPVEPVRVVLVDDSAVVRLALSAVVNRQSDLVVAGSAKNGQEAIDVVARTQPDVVVLDMEMPVLDGLGALKVLKKNWPKLPVIMFSTLTDRGTEATVEALTTGADDYLTKPSTMSGPDRGFDAVITRMLPLLRMWGSISHQRQGAARPATVGRGQADEVHGAAATAPPAPETAKAERGHEPASATKDARSRLVQARSATAAARSATAAARSAARPLPAPSAAPIVVRPGTPNGPVSAVVIGASTGGPNALSTVLPQLPVDLGVPVLVVQHMPATFTRLLAERLDRAAALSVEEVAQDTPVRAGKVYLAAGGYHMVVNRSGPEVMACAADGPAEHSCRPAVDVLMRSAVSVWQGGILAVILTGMGQDGLLGAGAVVGAGGTVIVQDEASSVVWGMPGAVARTGIASEILSLDEVASAITRRVKPSRTQRATGRPGPSAPPLLSKVAIV